MFKKIIKYYLFIERPLTIMSLTLVLTVIGLVIVLLVNGLIIITESAIHYYRVRSVQEEFCLDLPNTYWKDETFMGFGKDGSYGCFHYEESNK